MANGNDVVSSDFLKVLLALKENIMKDIHCSELAIVKSISENECVCSLLSDENKKINAFKLPSLEVKVGDIVVIIFNDSEFRSNLQKYNNQKTLQITSINKHSINHGIILSIFSKNSDSETKPGLPLGTILTLAVETDEPYLQKLDGRNLSQTGIYADFCTWLKNQINKDVNNVPTCTIEEYAAEMATYGQCGKFVINDTDTDISENFYVVNANSIKLPTITEFIASNNGGDAIGLAELDDIKTHRHMMPLSDESNPTGLGGGLSTGSVRENYQWTATGLGTAYTGGEETRPKNIRYPYYIVVATIITDSATISAEGVVNEVNMIKDELRTTNKIKLVYDAFSTNPDINKDKTGGILGDTWGALMLNLNAKGCYVYARAGSVLGTRFYIDLSIFNIPNPPSEFTATGFVKSQVTVDVHNRYRLFGFNITMHKFENGFQFSVREVFEYYLGGSGGYTQHQNDSEYYVYKVEEVY